MVSCPEGGTGMRNASGEGSLRKAPFTVLITGGIGSGKSVVCDFLRSRGVPAYDSDSSVKSLYDKRPDMVDALEDRLGLTLRNEDGVLDRHRLASVIFASDEALRLCEAIVHPALLEDFILWRATVSGGKWCGYLGQIPFVCVESAIAMERPMFRPFYDVAVCVTADEEVRIERVCGRDGCGRDGAAARMRAQSGWVSQADYVIVNDGTRSDLEKKVDDTFRIIVSEIGLQSRI